MSTITTAAMIGSAAIGAGGSLAAAKIGSSAASRSAKTQTDAANEAARIQQQIAEKQLDYQREQARILRADTELARQGNYGQWLAGLRNDAGQFNVNNRNTAGMFNVGNRMSADMANAGAFNQRAEFNVTRGDTNAIRTARAQDMSNLRAMLGGSAYTPATFGEIEPLERVTPGMYTPENMTPEEAPYVPGYDPNAPRTT